MLQHWVEVCLSFGNVFHWDKKDVKLEHYPRPEALRLPVATNKSSPRHTVQTFT